MNLSLSYYNTLLLSVKTLVVAGKRKVAKPIFMLAIIQAIDEHLITENKIKYTEGLENIYIKLYAKYGETLSPMKYPFYHLQSDGFYHIEGSLTTQSPTPKQLKEKIKYAYFDEQLWNLLKNEENRTILKKSLENYFNLKTDNAYGNKI